MPTPDEPLRDAEQRATEAIFRAVVRQSTDLIIVMDAEVVLYASPSAAELLGRDLVGLDLPALATPVHPDDLAMAIARFGEIWAQPGTYDAIELRIRDANGAWHLIELTATNLMNEPTVGGVVMSGRDITSRQAERERRRHQLDVVGLLAAGAAHDFGNLLGVIANCTQLAIRQLAPDDPVQTELQTIEHAVERASELTHQLLQFGGSPSGRTVHVDLNEVVAGVIALVERSPDHEVQFAQQPAAGPITVDIDRRRIERALVNLLLNARAASAPGSTVTVTVSSTEVDTVRAATDGIDAGRYAVVTIRDEGRGMTPDVLERAFEPFFTTSTDHGGTGLGLAAAQDAVDRAGGHITLASTVGAGTTASVLLPLLD